jgi:hypothetical protein
VVVLARHQVLRRQLKRRVVVDAMRFCKRHAADNEAVHPRRRELELLDGGIALPVSLRLSLTRLLLDRAYREGDVVDGCLLSRGKGDSVYTATHLRFELLVDGTQLGLLGRITARVSG